MMGIEDAIQIDLGFHFRTAAFQIFCLKMVFTILIVKFVVRIEFLNFTFGFFLSGKVAHGSLVVWTLVTETLVDGFMRTLLPDGESGTAIRTEIFRIGFVTDTLRAIEMVTNFITDLIALFPIIEVKEFGRNIAGFATTRDWNAKPTATPDWVQRFFGTFFKFIFEFTPVRLR